MRMRVRRRSRRDRPWATRYVRVLSDHLQCAHIGLLPQGADHADRRLLDRTVGAGRPGEAKSHWLPFAIQSVIALEVRATVVRIPQPTWAQLVLEARDRRTRP